MARPTNPLEAFGFETIGRSSAISERAIKNIQMCVIDFSPNPGREFLNGYWSEETIQATKEFQKHADVYPADGIVNKQTKDALWVHYLERLKNSGHKV